MPEKLKRVLLRDGAPIEPATPKSEIVGYAGQMAIKSDGQRLSLETAPQESDMPDLVDPNGKKVDASPITASLPNKPVEKEPKPDVDPQNPKKLSDYVVVTPVEGGLLTSKFRGVCKKCAFQSYQPTKELAQGAVEFHAQKHLIGR
jgi:hypothetical protein